MESQKIKLYSYTKVWNVEKKIYSFQNFVLPAPVNPFDILYFFSTIGVIFIVGKLFVPLHMLPAAIKFLVFPYLITTYMRKKKLDGKNPIKYFIDYSTNLLLVKGKYLEGFEIHTGKQKTVTLNWKCSVMSR